MGARALDDLARHSVSSPGTKLDARIDVPVSGELKDAITAIAMVHGYGSAAEYVREVLDEHVNGALRRIQGYGSRRLSSRG